MRKLTLAMAASLALIVLSAVAVHAQTRFIYSPSDGYLNLREGPSTNYPIIQPMYNGQRVWIIGRSGNWRQVRHESGTVGWAYHSYLTRDQVQSGGQFFINSPGDGYLNLRSRPSGSSRIIRQMPHGSRVQVVGSTGAWLNVIHSSGAQGWAHHRYMSSSRPPTQQQIRRVANCSGVHSGAVGWYIRLYKCGDVPAYDYPACLARWRQRLCEVDQDPAAFMQLLMTERG